jgi:dTDP-4-amino-4,6-dideoxygalactose transaminase
MKQKLEKRGLEMPASNTRAFYRMLFLGGANATSLLNADQLEREIIFLPTFTFEEEDEIDIYVEQFVKLLGDLL